LTLLSLSALCMAGYVGMRRLKSVAA
jgi:hypothetical protein